MGDSATGPCAVCGQPTASKGGVCQRTAECKREYHARWQKANREAELERHRRYYQANREALDERNRRWTEANPGAVRAIKRRWKEANREACLEGSRRYREANRDVLRERSNRYYEANREAHLERTNRYYQANREQVLEHRRNKSREWRLRYKHDMHPDEWIALWDTQLGLCYLCGDPLIEDQAGIEHDHSCCPSPYTCWICRRGLACHDCNVAIGFANDDPHRLRRMADALEAAQLEVARRKSAPSAVLHSAVIGTLLTICAVPG
jgi:hypothetical protein